MTAPAPNTGEQSWLHRALTDELPKHIERMKKVEPSVEWLHRELVDTTLQLIGDFGADARNKAKRFEAWLDSLTTHVDAHERALHEQDEAFDEHEDRLVSLEAFVEALGQVTQLLPGDADDISKLAAGAKWIATEVLTKGEQTPDGQERLAELIALAERVSKLVEAARLEVESEPDEGEEDEDVIAPAPEPEPVGPN